MTRRVLVTGAEGFVGGHLRARLSDLDLEVVSGVAADASRVPNSTQFDLCDAASIEALVAGAGAVDWVVHLAAITFVPDAARSPARVMDVNLVGTINLLESIKRHSPRARVLMVGSSQAYGPPQSLPVTEGHPLVPGDPYAISKAAADQYCGYAGGRLGLDIVRARPFNHAGAGQAPSFVLSAFARQIVEMETGARAPELHVGNISVARDFSHVSDVVEAYLALLERGRSGEAYNVCSGTALRLDEILDRLLRMTDLAVEVRPDPDRMRGSEVAEVRGSHQKLTLDTDWRPTRGMDDILADLLGYWRSAMAGAGKV